jgi:hypothetical protein
MVVCLELGFRLGLRDSMRNPERAHEGVGVIDAAVFALLGLLLGFSFAGGTSRLDARRELVVREANAIGTAYLRIDLLPSDAQPEMRHLFRKYLDARLRVYESLPDEKATEQALADVRKLQQEIWTRAISSSHGDSSQNIGRLLLPALNEMIDITTARTIAMRTHLPALIFVLLAAVALLSGVLAGFAMAKRQSRSWLHLVLYAGVVSVTIYAVLDLDYPRSGFIRLGAADSALIQLRDSIR